MEPEEPRRWRAGRAPSAAEPRDETDVERRMVRFVWTSATFVGVVGRARRAAAAAADERDGDDSRRLNAEAAAVAALGFAVAALRGWAKTRLASVMIGAVPGNREARRRERIRDHPAVVD